MEETIKGMNSTDLYKLYIQLSLNTKSKPTRYDIHTWNLVKERLIKEGIIQEKDVKNLSLIPNKKIS